MPKNLFLLDVIFHKFDRLQSKCFGRLSVRFLRTKATTHHIWDSLHILLGENHLNQGQFPKTIFLTYISSHLQSFLFNFLQFQIFP